MIKDYHWILINCGHHPLSQITHFINKGDLVVEKSGKCASFIIHMFFPHHINFPPTLLLFWAAAPKGLMTYAFTHGEISPFPPVYPTPPLRPYSSIEAQILDSRPKSQPWGLNPRLEAQIPGSRLKSQAQGSNPKLKAQILGLRLKSQARGSNPSPKAQIPGLRLKSQPPGSNPSFEAWIPALKL